MAKSKSRKKRKGLFITLEGIDGCGKSTQAAALAQWLREEGYDVLHTREPGATEFGAQMRALVTEAKRDVVPEAELMYYLADRAQHIAQVLRPALEAGRIVISERYTDSTLAYQGAGRGLDFVLLERLNSLVTGGLKPDITFVLDIPPEEGLQRKYGPALFENNPGGSAPAGPDRLEKASPDFRQRVAQGYREIARREPERVKIIDASSSREVVTEALIKVVDALLQREETSGRKEVKA